MPPFLSVVIPTYNGGKFIGAALRSICEQREEGLELIIVDDGSTDRTLEIVRDFAKMLPIRLLTPQRIGNWVAASNIGLREATAEWACFLHQDDLWLPRRVAKLRPEIEEAEGALIIHNARFVGPEGQYLGPWTCPLIEGSISSSQFIEHLLIQNFIAIPSPVFRRSAAIDTGGLDEALWFSADWDLWLRLGSLGPVRFMNETLAAFRIHPASQTASRCTNINEWKQQLTVVFERYFQNWDAPRNLKKRVERTATVSINVNSTLSAASRGQPVRFLPLLPKLVRLGPFDCRRYLRDSRIVQRVRPRLRLFKGKRWRHPERH